MYSITAGKLTFSISESADKASFSATDLVLSSVKDCDFFRIFLDNGIEREIAVLSKDQRGSVKAVDESTYIISYDTLADEYGRVYDVKLNITVKCQENAMIFIPEITNGSEVRVNEIQCPFVELSAIASEDTSADILYRPVGLGERLPDPINQIRKQNHSEYMFADYEHVWRCATYPYPLSMAWLGIESGENFLYLGRHDEQLRTCAISVGASARKQPDSIVLTVSHYPAVLCGERVVCGESVFALLDGGWKRGADFYTKWAGERFIQRQIPAWVQNMTGWQRIIMKHQYGKIYFKYKDLVTAYENGRKCGLDTLLVFGWWRGCFDNGYPIYEPDDALGGADELKWAIDEIHRRGGRVILYNNGVLLDVTTDYYKQIGERIEKKNIEGISYREYYAFADYGTMLRYFGHKTFSSACHANDEWKQKLVENAKIKLSFDPDSIFFDQLGGHLPRLCFDNRHKHGNRIDEDVKYKIENVGAVREIMPADKCIGTENVLDAMVGCFDFSHGCIYAGYKEYRFPSLFRYAFPDVVVTNRFAHDEKDSFRHELNFAFVNGLRYDVSIYRGRLIDVSGMPEYSEHLKNLLSLKEKYREYFYEGKFIGEDEQIDKPHFITANLFESPDGKRLLALWNESSNDYTVSAYGSGIRIGANEVVLKEI